MKKLYKRKINKGNPDQWDGIIRRATDEDIANLPSTLFVCHGKKHFGWQVPLNIKTLDIKKESDPDIVANILDLNFIKKNYFYKNKFDRLVLVYCPTSIFMNTSPVNNWRITNMIIPIRHVFINLHFLLKYNGLLTLNNFISSCLPHDNYYEELDKYNKTKKWPDYVYANIKNFVGQLSDLFVIEKIDIMLTLRKI